MKFMMILLGAAAALTLSAHAQDATEEFVATCEAYNDANGADANCSCLAEAAAENEDLYAEYAKVTKPEDVDLMSDEAKEVVATCAAE